MCLTPSQPDTSAAERAEQERQARINQGMGAVNAAFDNPERAGIYDDLYASTLDRNTQDLDRQYEDAMRQARFASARRGQVGGSAGADRVSGLREQYDTGAQRAATLAEDARQAAMTDDERTRQSLIDQVYGGMSATDASRRAMEALDVNQRTASQRAAQSALGRAFAQAGDVYGQARNEAGRIQARRDFEDQFGSYYPASGSYSGQVS